MGRDGILMSSTTFALLLLSFLLLNELVNGVTGGGAGGSVHADEEEEEAPAPMSCPQMALAVVPCFGYIVAGGDVPAECCSGLKAVKAAAPTTELCRQACACMQWTAAAIPGVNYDLVNTLPQKCHFSISFKLTPSTDCSKVHAA
ncbi:hypothetical protein H6P81_016821 [Aristolochia fimbriata]|uniref:Non-specific lipid-transfer protein n=1 Tax=Aristolochia fimbriata TaxID=158543 RepID=A0AAV7ECB1_ARIFI|nr:hypothetical protein H6P81_016821 [Aristolochia fimbriata]